MGSSPLGTLGKLFASLCLSLPSHQVPGALVQMRQSSEGSEHVCLQPRASCPAPPRAGQQLFAICFLSLHHGPALPLPKRLECRHALSQLQPRRSERGKRTEERKITKLRPGQCCLALRAGIWGPSGPPHTTHKALCLDPI